MKTTIVTSMASLLVSSFTLAASTDDLIRLYEEEILAHDLYVELGKTHPDIRPFKNIPQSEARHRVAMEAILKKEQVDLPEPAKGKKFVTPGLDRTFKRWLKEGKKTPADACRVGVRLEEHDIVDLRNAAKDFPAHRAVLEQLEMASGNHLRAFHRNLTAYDGTYKAEVMTDAEWTRVLAEEGSCGAGCGAKCDAGPGPKGQGGAQKGKARAGQGSGRGPRGQGGPGPNRRGPGGPNR